MRNNENKWFDRAERYYNKEYYTNEDVKIFVKAKKINEEEYKQITKEDYAQ